MGRSVVALRRLRKLQKAKRRAKYKQKLSGNTSGLAVSGDAQERGVSPCPTKECQPDQSGVASVPVSY